MEAEEDEDEEKTKAMNAVATVFGGLMTSSSLFRHTGRRITDITFRKSNNLKHTSSSASPIGSSSNEKEKLQLDIAALRKQYAKLRERQKQAHVMFWTVASGASSSARRGSSDGTTVFSSSSASSSTNPVNHLLASRKPLLARRPSVSSSPSTSSNPSQQGPKLRLPPPRIPPALGTNSNDDKVRNILPFDLRLKGIEYKVSFLPLPACQTHRLSAVWLSHPVHSSLCYCTLWSIRFQWANWWSVRVFL